MQLCSRCAAMCGSGCAGIAEASIAYSRLHFRLRFVGVFFVCLLAAVRVYECRAFFFLGYNRQLEPYGLCILTHNQTKTSSSSSTYSATVAVLSIRIQPKMEQTKNVVSRFVFPWPGRPNPSRSLPMADNIYNPTDAVKRVFRYCRLFLCVCACVCVLQ